MFAHLEKTLIRIGFLSRGNPGHIMRSIKRLFSQAELTERDVQIIRGIMSQMDWYSREGVKMRPEEVEKP
jgi:tRNA/rRNA methyltransferase